MLRKGQPAPEKGHSVSRLELCGAVCGSRFVSSLYGEVKFYTDRKGIFGIYVISLGVSNCVQKTCQ